MHIDLQVHLRAVADHIHHGRPELIRQIHSGGRGRPSYEIDPQFLLWASSIRSTSSIARFLGVSRTVVRNALLEYAIAEPQEAPFPAEQAGEHLDNSLNPPDLPNGENEPLQPGKDSVFSDVWFEN